MTEELPETTRASNAALRAQIDSMLDSYERGAEALVEAQRRATEPVTVWSDDNLVRVSATVTGIVEIHVEADAFKRSTPQTLGAAITQTAQRAQQRAAEAQAEALAPWTGPRGALPDLPDLVPGAPSTAELRARLTPPPPQDVDAPPLGDDDEDEDDYFRNQGYLR